MALGGLILVLGLVQAGKQVGRTTYRMAADTRNPWVYGHTSTNFMHAVTRLREFTAEGNSLAVVHAEHAWPLPWYLRDRELVGYFEKMPAQIEADALLMDARSDEPVPEAFEGDALQSGNFGLRPGALVYLITPK